MAEVSWLKKFPLLLGKGQGEGLGTKKTQIYYSPFAVVPLPKA
jgi:hypothetical protein